MPGLQEIARFDPQQRRLSYSRVPHASWWADDSKAFAILASAPIGSVWEKREANARAVFSKGRHLFVVNVKTLTTSEVLGAAAAEDGATVVNWKRSNIEMVVEADKDRVFVKMRPAGQEWLEVNRFTLSVDRGLVRLGAVKN